MDGRDVGNASEDELVEYRRSDVGFVFQFYNLVPNPDRARERRAGRRRYAPLAGTPPSAWRRSAWRAHGELPRAALRREQQRVSIARAIAKNPKLLLCDEPTGALDYQTGKQVLQLLQDTCRRDGITVVIITHILRPRPDGGPPIRFKSGRVTDIQVNEHPVPIADIEW